MPHLVKKTPIRSGAMDKTQGKLPQSGIFQWCWMHTKKEKKERR